MGGKRVQLIDYAVVRGKAIDSVEPRIKTHSEMLLVAALLVATAVPPVW